MIRKLREFLEFDLGKVAGNIFTGLMIAYILFTLGVSVYLFFFSPVSQTLITVLRRFYSLEGGWSTLICFLAFIPHFIIWMFFYAGMVWWIFWIDWFGDSEGITVYNAIRLLLVVIAPWIDPLFGAELDRVALLVAGEGILGMLLSAPTLFIYMGREMGVFSFKDLLMYLFQLVPVIIGIAAFIPMFIDALRLGIISDPLHDIRWYASLMLGSFGAMGSFKKGLLAD
ncbi:MAG: hypothetical protein ABIM74_01110 [candidate division WOR-3 bacterium]